MFRWLRIRWLVGRYYYNKFMCSHYSRELRYYGDMFGQRIRDLKQVVKELEELGCE